MYAYSIHRTKREAELALEDYYASGEVFPCEFARIRQRMNSVGKIWFDIMLWGV